MSCTIVMVPNSLGPGELIEKYGTDEQKHHYLPRLAKGVEVPCFSLTGPTSGSDAATMRDIGTVTRGTCKGQETRRHPADAGTSATSRWVRRRRWSAWRSSCLIRKTCWVKGEDIGITVALIPADYPGVNIGRRHLPCGSAFPNGPNWGKDVFIPMEFIIGGEKMVGHGWRMLMECLAAGRAISLPSSATAGAKAMLRLTTAYGRIRKQFGLPVAQDGRHRRAARAHGRDGLCQRGRACGDGVDGQPRREAVGDLGADEVPDDGAHAPLRQ